MKKNEKKRIINVKSVFGILISFLAALCILVTAAVSAAELSAQEERVIDTYGLFSDDETAELESACLQFEQKTGIRTAILSVDVETAGGRRDSDSIRYIEAYSDALSESDFIGLIINMETRYYYIDVKGNEALRVYTDSRQEQLGDAVVDKLAAGEYAASGMVFLNMAAQQFAYAHDTGSYGTIREEETGFDGETFGMAAFLAAIVSGIITAVRARRHKERKIATEANRYIVPGTINLHRNRNVFVSQYVTRVPIAQEKNDSGGGGFTTTHTSGGGSSHSGHGGHF